MAARKRPSLKGRGASIFLSEGETEQKRTTNQSTRMPASTTTSKTESPNAGMPANGYSGLKEKATFYLPEELLFQLEVVWRDLRVMTRSKVTKSDIVQAAIERITSEFQQQGSSSLLLKDLRLVVNGSKSPPM